jgi:hypothetical protein
MAERHSRFLFPIVTERSAMQPLAVLPKVALQFAQAHDVRIRHGYWFFFVHPHLRRNEIIEFRFSQA